MLDLQFDANRESLSLSLSLRAKIRKSKGPPPRVCHVNFGDSVNKGVAAKCNQIRYETDVRINIPFRRREEMFPPGRGNG